MPASYEDAPDVASIARKLIDEVPDHGWLAGRPVAYVFRVADKPSDVRVKAQVLAGGQGFLSRREGVLIVDELNWRLMPWEGRVALVDHGLSHFGCDDDGRLCLLKPPVAEFLAVVQRRGLWHKGLEAIADAIALGPRPQSMLRDDTTLTITTPDGTRVDTTTGEVRRFADAVGRR